MCAGKIARLIKTCLRGGGENSSLESLECAPDDHHRTGGDGSVSTGRGWQNRTDGGDRRQCRCCGCLPKCRQHRVCECLCHSSRNPRFDRARPIEVPPCGDPSNLIQVYWGVLLYSRISFFSLLTFCVIFFRHSIQTGKHFILCGS